MATADLRQGTFDVHQVMGDSVQVNTAYGVITVPNGHYIVNFPGDFEFAVPLPPEAFNEMFEAPADQTAPAQEAPAPAPTEAPAEPAPAPEAPAEAPAPTDTTQPAEAPAEAPAPAPAEPTGPAEADVRAWVDGHYAETYREGVYNKLMANPQRAQELLTQYPLPAAPGTAVPPPEQI